MCYEQPEISLPTDKPSEKQMYANMERMDAQIAAWRQSRVEEYSRELFSCQASLECIRQG